MSDEPIAAIDEAMKDFLEELKQRGVEAIED
jgi:hypothetical protein